VPGKLGGIVICVVGPVVLEVAPVLGLIQLTRLEVVPALSALHRPLHQSDRLGAASAKLRLAATVKTVVSSDQIKRLCAVNLCAVMPHRPSKSAQVRTGSRFDLIPARGARRNGR
jgi:hypothetical protein